MQWYSNVFRQRPCRPTPSDFTPPIQTAASILHERNGAPTFFGSTARFEFPDFTPPIQAAASTLKLAPKPVQRKGILQKNNRCTPCRSFAPPRLTPIFNPSNKSDSRIFRASPLPFSFRMRRFRFSLRNRRVSPHQKRGANAPQKFPSVFISS